MSKKKLTKKKKKRLLVLFTATTMTINIAVAPLSALAEESKVSSDAGSAVNVLEKNVDLPETTTDSEDNSENDSSDFEDKVEENIVETSESTVVEKEVMEKNEAVKEQTMETETKEGIITGSYENGGEWAFDQDSGSLTLTGGSLTGGSVNEAYSNSTWLRSISKNDVLEIHVVNAVGGKNLSSLFVAYSKVRKITFDNFDTSQTTLMRSMFNGCKNLTDIDLSTFDTRKVTGMSSMFYDCTKLSELDLSGFYTEKLQTTQLMFQGCTNLKKLNLSNFDTSLVTNMTQMFASCNRIEELNLGSKTKLKDRSITNLKSVSATEFWYDTSSNKILDATEELISYHNKSNETKNYILSTYKYENNGVWAFKNGRLTLTGGNLSASIGENSWIKYLDKNDIREIQVKNATGREDLTKLFSEYEYVERITFDNFDATKVTDMTMMFANCYALENLNLSSFSMNNIIDDSMFLNADNLNTLTLGGEFKLSQGSGLKIIDDSELWYSELGNDLLRTSNDLIDYHNNLNKTNTYTLVDSSEQSLSLKFDTMGGSEISAIETIYGNVWTEPKEPIKQGYTFEGWYEDTEYTKEFNFSKPATKTMTIYAKWGKVNFDVNNYHIGDYNITGRFSAPIVTAQLRINGSLSNKGGTFNKNDGTFYYYA
ncbi:hypothetical protein C6N01_14670, partial [Enterococcus faecalis]|uniref:BspA family leucine-rich repeat surface protein n=1 Tax=Enterococcus faecalis TaxID=1351 RepID=UPI001363B324